MTVSGSVSTSDDINRRSEGEHHVATASPRPPAIGRARGGSRHASADAPALHAGGNHTPVLWLRDRTHHRPPSVHGDEPGRGNGARAPGLPRGPPQGTDHP